MPEVDSDFISKPLLVEQLDLRQTILISTKAAISVLQSRTEEALDLADRIDANRGQLGFATVYTTQTNDGSYMVAEPNNAIVITPNKIVLLAYILSRWY